MKELRLTQGKVAIVDDEDFESLLAFRWHAFRTVAGSWYAGRTALTERGKRRVLLHRQILGAPHGVLVDHRNRNGLDNRRSNLRLATGEQNAQNRVRHHEKSSRFHGVSWYAPTSRWKAQIQAAGKKRGLGYFTEEEAAARAYDRAALEAFGEFAVINLPTTSENTP